MNPIYDAPPAQQLKDLSQSVHMALLMMDYGPIKEAEADQYTALSDGEFAVGNWIVRPRFKDEQY